MPDKSINNTLPWPSCKTVIWLTGGRIRFLRALNIDRKSCFRVFFPLMRTMWTSASFSLSAPVMRSDRSSVELYNDRLRWSLPFDGQIHVFPAYVLPVSGQDFTTLNSCGHRPIIINGMRFQTLKRRSLSQVLLSAVAGYEGFAAALPEGKRGTAG